MAGGARKFLPGRPYRSTRGITFLWSVSCACLRHRSFTLLPRLSGGLSVSHPTESPVSLLLHPFPTLFVRPQEHMNEFYGHAQGGRLQQLTDMFSMSEVHACVCVCVCVCGEPTSFTLAWPSLSLTHTHDFPLLSNLGRGCSLTHDPMQICLLANLTQYFRDTQLPFAPNHLFVDVKVRLTWWCQAMRLVACPTPLHSPRSIACHQHGAPLGADSPRGHERHYAVRNARLASIQRPPPHPSMC